MPPSDYKTEDVSRAYLVLLDTVRARWDAFSEASPENARLRRIAERMSGLGGREGTLNNIVCIGEPPIVGANAPIKHFAMGYGELMPAWALWLNLARDAIEAVNAD